MAVWILEAPLAPLFRGDIPMELDHAGNVLPALANDLFARVILLDSSDQRIVESLQVLAAFHWHSFSMICLLAVLLHSQIEIQQADSALYEQRLVTHLVLVEGVLDGGSSYHALVPYFIVRCILAVISCIVTLPHADVQTWL